MQDWVGGYIVTSPQQQQLYELSYFKSVQHDPALTGFEWQATKYYPPVYSPAYYWLVSPLSNMNYKAAAICWLLFSIACFGVWLVVLKKFQIVSADIVGWIPIVAALFAPLLYGFNIGHKSAMILLILTLAYQLLRKNRTFAAGMCCGLLAFKPQLMLVLCLLMLVRRDWRFLSGVVVSCLGWLALMLMISPDLTLDYIRTLLSTQGYLQTEGYQFGLAHSIWSGVELSLGWTGFSGWLGLILVAAILSWLGWQSRFCQDAREDSLALWFSISIIATVLVSPHFYYYDLTILLLPIVLCLNLCKSAVGNRQLEQRLTLGLIVAFFALAGSFAWIADQVGIQLSLPLMLAWIYLLVRMMRQPNASDRESNIRQKPDELRLAGSET